MLGVLKLGYCRTCHNPALECTEHCSSLQRLGTARTYTYFISIQISYYKSVKLLVTGHCIPMSSLIDYSDICVAYVCQFFVNCISDGIKILVLFTSFQ